MCTKFFRILFLLLALINRVVCEEISDKSIRSIFLERDISELPISDWKNPTFHDCMLIQRQLYINLLRATLLPQAERGHFSNPLYSGEYYWILGRISKLRLIDERNPRQTQPKFEIVHFNNDPKKRDKCVVCYCSWPVPGRNYINIHNIIKGLESIAFDGHLIYRIGGWPNPAKERLKYADVPYSCKPFLMEEARDLGYKNILWLDVCALPIKKLDLIFDHIEKNGCCFFPGFPGEIPDYFIDPRKYMIKALGISLDKPYYDLSSRIVGLNVEHPTGKELLSRWIEAAEKKDAFFNGNVDQTVLCYLVNDMGIYEKCQLPMNYYWEGNAKEWEEIPAAVFESPAFFYFSYALIEDRHREQKLQGSYPAAINDTIIPSSVQIPQYIHDYFSQNPAY